MRKQVFLVGLAAVAVICCGWWLVHSSGILDSLQGIQGGTHTNKDKIYKRLKACLEVVDGRVVNPTWTDEKGSEPPVPELYYDDYLHDEERTYIWPSSSTMPRDVLKRLPDVHLYVQVCPTTSDTNDDLKAFESGFLSFVTYYMSKGIQPRMMMFGLAVWPNNGIGLYSRIIQMIKALGADYHVWIESENDFQRRKEGYISMLWALRHFPLQDWVIFVKQGELIDFGVDSIHDYFDNCERNGANYAMIYDKEYDASKIFVIRGYLRFDEACSRVFDIEGAEEYFGRGLFRPDIQTSESLRNSVFSLTPYDTWWEFYKSSTMVGNAYLWYPRDGCDDATHTLSNSSETSHIIEKCSIASLLALKYISKS